MLQNAFGILASAFDGVYSWFVTIFQRVGGIGYLMGILFAMFAIRFIVNPFLKGGVGASDPVRNVRRRNDSSRGS